MSRQTAPLKAVLLTGAGFSKPFGGYLAAEMWAAILRQRELREFPTLRERMLADLNFEAVYEEVMTTSLRPEPEKHAFTEAIWRSYLQMHDEMRAGARETGASGACQTFLAKFQPRHSLEKGFIFTLNQDLFVETYHTNDVPLLLPGVPQSHSDDGREMLTLPDAATVNEIAGTFWGRKGDPLLYVKLHGSMNWRRSDQSRAMVIGTNKGQLLADEPLLNWYVQLFQQTLETTQALLVIGYSFRDQHINKMIVQAVKSSGLRLYVMSPQLPETFKSNLQQVAGVVSVFSPEGDDIWRSLFGYYCGGVTDFYTKNQRQLPPKAKALFEDLGLT